MPPTRSIEAGRRVRLPQGAERPITVFVNGIEQTEGSDYSVHRSEIVFSRQIIKEQLGRARMLAMSLGLFGSYHHNETIDVHFRQGGQTRTISDAKVLPD